MKVTWTIDDGYMGNGPQQLIVPDSYLEDMNEAEIMEEVEEWVQTEFDTNVSFTITHLNGKEV